MLFLHCRLALDLVQHNASVMRTMRRAYGHTSICKARAAQEQTLNPSGAGIAQPHQAEAGCRTNTLPGHSKPHPCVWRH